MGLIQIHGVAYGPPAKERQPACVARYRTRLAIITAEVMDSATAELYIACGLIA